MICSQLSWQTRMKPQRCDRCSTVDFRAHEEDSVRAFIFQSSSEQSVAAAASWHSTLPDGVTFTWELSVLARIAAKLCLFIHMRTCNP